ncbi:MAG: hypothetical protein HY268_34765 [Deltaproteobacteria bacterium]|nr:hypothetical protein [Deltaproteobacteria bacterium]
MMTSVKVEQLRRKHPRFIYHSFAIERSAEALKLRFHFTIEPDLQFTPETVIEAADWDRIKALSPGLLELFVFQLGLVEMLSYWKAACSPELLVQAGSLDAQQIEWWTDLLLYGMREFFYVNQIDFTTPGFIHITSSALGKHDDKECHAEPEQSGGEESRLDRDLVLMSGGKDSALSVQLLRELEREFHCLLLNPTPAAEAITAQVGDRMPIIVRRTIDPRLLTLNQAGYLNGHTPFSAYLAMLGVTCAVLFGYRRVIVANERSADEGNVEFLGSEVNHQYSKTLRFERAFRWYSQTYLSRDVEYFSLLRPLYELQIARLFARYPQYFSAFTSCNRKQKEGSWCKQCSKCLSTFTLLYPFLTAADITRIFGEDLFERTEAIPMMRELLGFAEHKPFECVGTREEMLVALYLGIQQAKTRDRTLPAVLRHVEVNLVPQHPDLSQRVKSILHAWSDQHHLPLAYTDLLRKHLES